MQIYSDIFIIGSIFFVCQYFKSVMEKRDTKRLMLRIVMRIPYFCSCFVHLLTERLEQVALISPSREKLSLFLLQIIMPITEVVVRINESMCIRRFKSP